jgi:phage shock protein B
VHEGDTVIAVFSVFAIFIAFPWIVLNFLSRKRDAAVQAAGDPALNATLTGVADRMEKRLDAIESLLDSEVPGWRPRSGDNPQRSDRS